MVYCRGEGSDPEQSQSETSKLDSILLDKLSTQLLSNITAQITYADGTNSRDRYAEYLEKGSAPYIDTTNLHYVTQEDHDKNGEAIGNVYLFRYQDQKLALKPSNTLFDFGFKPLRWCGTPL